MNFTNTKKINKTKYLEKRFGGRWKYDGFSWWDCDDGERYVVRVASCMCDDDCYHFPDYYLYQKDCVPQRVDWF